MNNTRRNEIARVETQVRAAMTALAQAKDILENEKAEEESTFADASEGKQNGDWGQESQACIDAMQTLIDEIESVDLSEAMDELGRAIDRDLEAPKGRLSKAEAEQRRHNRLPQWAKDAMVRAKASEAAAIERSKAKLEDWKDGSRNPMFDAWHGELKGKEIPCERVKFPQVGVSVYLENGKLCIHGDHALFVMPRSGNEVHIKSDHWDALD